MLQDVHCFGEDTCYPLAFGVPALLMLASTGVLLAGRSLYVMRPPRGNVLTSVAGSVACAARRRMTSRKSSSGKKRHWMDEAVAEG